MATTCIKPSGTVSQLVGVAGSGLHPSYSKHYIRRVRQDIKDPLNAALIGAGQPYIPDPYNKDALVFEFPMKILSGVSFLPKADDAHIYEAAPYEEINSEAYNAMLKKTNLAIDWDSVVEENDNTTGSQELACTAGACEI